MTSHDIVIVWDIEYLIFVHSIVSTNSIPILFYVWQMKTTEWMLVINVNKLQMVYMCTIFIQISIVAYNYYSMHKKEATKTKSTNPIKGKPYARFSKTLNFHTFKLLPRKAQGGWYWTEPILDISQCSPEINQCLRSIPSFRAVMKLYLL